MEIIDRYQPLAAAIENGDPEAGVAEARRLVAGGIGLREIYLQAVTPVLKDIGDRFSRLELYLPDMIRAAEVVKAIHSDLESTLVEEGGLESAGRIVIGTIYGDIHDLGKNIVISMLEVNGFEVHDLGVNVEAFEFLKKAREVGADIVAVSSLLTTSLPYVEDVVKMIRSGQPDPTFRILIGGGPVTAEFAERIGADGYGEDAADAVRQAARLMHKN